jgi:hypothetical protein
MLDHAVSIHILDFGVGNAAVVLKERRQPPASNITTLVDCSSQYRTAVFAIPNRIIGAAAEE